MASVTEPAALAARRDRVADRRQVLERRLDDGYQRIDDALRAGVDVTAWEAFWVELLHEYEGLFEDLGRAA